MLLYIPLHQVWYPKPCANLAALRGSCVLEGECAIEGLYSLRVRNKGSAAICVVQPLDIEAFSFGGSGQGNLEHMGDGVVLPKPPRSTHMRGSTKRCSLCSRAQRQVESQQIERPSQHRYLGKCPRSLLSHLRVLQRTCGCSDFPSCQP